MGCQQNSTKLKYIREDIITEPLKEALDECYKSGGLTGSMKQGDIVLIYKKKDPKEIRNYRPITLLNSDYMRDPNKGPLEPHSCVDDSEAGSGQQRCFQEGHH